MCIRDSIYNDGSGTVDIGKAMEGFLTFLPPQMKIEKPVVQDVYKRQILRILPWTSRLI